MYKAGHKVKGIIEEYKQALQKLGIGIKRVILYGSFARGSQREDSDIDIIVVSEDFREMNIRERQEVLGVAAARILKPIEARGYTSAEVDQAGQASFLKEVLEVGMVI